MEEVSTDGLEELKEWLCRHPQLWSYVSGSPARVALLVLQKLVSRLPQQEEEQISPSVKKKEFVTCPNCNGTGLWLKALAVPDSICPRCCGAKEVQVGF